MSQEPSPARRDESQDALIAKLLEPRGDQRLLPDLTLGLLHRLNNVMTSVCFTSEACEMEVPSDSAARDLLKALREAVDEAQQIVRRTSEVNLSYGSEDSEYHDLNALVRDNGELLRMLLPKGVDLRIEPDQLPLVVKISIADFRRIMFPLMTNAKAAAGEDSHVVIRCISSEMIDPAHYFPAPEVNLNDFVCVSVQDNGSGIPPANVRSIFEPFFTTHAGNVGLGLTAARHLAQRNGGMLLVNTHREWGSEFILALPRITF